MNQDFSELVEYLNEKFEKTAKKEDLANLSSKLVSFEEFDQFRKEVRQEISDLRESIQTLTNSVDKLVKAVEDLRQEFAAVTLKVDRHEKWLHQIAEKLGLKLEY